MASSTPNTSKSTAPPSTSFPPDHLDHPESWATGSNPATTKQLDFIHVLEKQKRLDVDEEELEGIDKTDASELISRLKEGKIVLPHHHETGEKRAAVEKEEGEGDEREVKKRKVEGEEEGVEAHTTEKDEMAENEAKNVREDHLEHPETWATGSEPATSKQLSFISLLQNQHPSFHLSPTKKDHLTKTEASEIIDGLKNGKEISVEGLGEEEVEGTKEKDKKEVTPSLDDDASPSKSTTTTKEDSEEKEKGGKPGTEEYLEHPETWATGEEPATEKQLAYLAVLEKQKGLEVASEEDKELGKSDASRKIEELKTRV